MKAIVAGNFKQGQTGTAVIELSESNLRQLLSTFEKEEMANLTNGGIGRGQVNLTVVQDSLHYT